MPESLRLFMLCEAMNWAHLPEQGGLYQQHPRLLDEWLEIFQTRHAHEEQKRIEKERAEARKNPRGAARQ